MIVRTESERQAYVDGYNNCFNSFVELLKTKDVETAIKKMKLLVVATNSTIEKE